MFWLGIFGVIVLAIAAITVLRGAPYVPTHKKAVNTALDVLDLKPGSLIVDLGSGDGIFLKAAAKRGLKACGYEINPVLWLVSVLRCWKYRGLVEVKLRDFWLVSLPKDVDAVFVFGGGTFMRRLSLKLRNEKKGQLLVVSYGFELPGEEVEKIKDGLNFYRLV